MFSFLLKENMYSQIFLFSKNECALGLVQQTGEVL